MLLTLTIRFCPLRIQVSNAKNAPCRLQPRLHGLVRAGGASFFGSHPYCEIAIHLMTSSWRLLRTGNSSAILEKCQDVICNIPALVSVGYSRVLDKFLPLGPDSPSAS